jgi:hypothetical protein
MHVLEEGPWQLSAALGGSSAEQHDELTGWSNTKHRACCSSLGNHACCCISVASNHTLHRHGVHAVLLHHATAFATRDLPLHNRHLVKASRNQAQCTSKVHRQHALSFTSAQSVNMSHKYQQAPYAGPKPSSHLI